jgi:hypothetical protein
MKQSQRHLFIGVLVSAIIASIGVAAWLQASGEQAPAQPVTAFITHVRPGMSGVSASIVTVTARTANGIYGRDQISANELLDRHCRVGDRVVGKIVGITLIFDASSCEPTQTPR